MRILFVGQNPAQKSPKTAFKNTKSGERLLRICNLADIDHNLVDFANVFPKPTPGNKKPTLKEICQYLPSLKKQVEKYPLIVVCGQVAAQAISELQKQSDHTLTARIFGIPHPSGLNRFWNNPRSEQLAADIIRYYYESFDKQKI